MYHLTHLICLILSLFFTFCLGLAGRINCRKNWHFLYFCSSQWYSRAGWELREMCIRLPAGSECLCRGIYLNSEKAIIKLTVATCMRCFNMTPHKSWSYLAQVHAFEWICILLLVHGNSEVCLTWHSKVSSLWPSYLWAYCEEQRWGSVWDWNAKV